MTQPTQIGPVGPADPFGQTAEGSFTRLATTLVDATGAALILGYCIAIAARIAAPGEVDIGPLREALASGRAVTSWQVLVVVAAVAWAAVAADTDRRVRNRVTLLAFGLGAVSLLSLFATTADTWTFTMLFSTFAPWYIVAAVRTPTARGAGAVLAAGAIHLAWTTAFTIAGFDVVVRGDRDYIGRQFYEFADPLIVPLIAAALLIWLYRLPRGFGSTFLVAASCLLATATVSAALDTAYADERWLRGWTVTSIVSAAVALVPVVVVVRMSPANDGPADAEHRSLMVSALAAATLFVPTGIAAVVKTARLAVEDDPRERRLLTTRIDKLRQLTVIFGLASIAILLLVATRGN